MILRSTGLDKALLKDWPADYDDMAVWSGLMDGLTYEASKPVTTAMLEQMLKNAAAIADKPRARSSPRISKRAACSSRNTLTR